VLDLLWKGLAAENKAFCDRPAACLNAVTMKPGADMAMKTATHLCGPQTLLQLPNGSVNTSLQRIR
jgi:hypothetical protein